MILYQNSSIQGWVLLGICMLLTEDSVGCEHKILVFFTPLSSNFLRATSFSALDEIS